MIHEKVQIKSIFLQTKCKKYQEDINFFKACYELSNNLTNSWIKKLATCKFYCMRNTLSFINE